jgi:hypothetical protein
MNETKSTLPVKIGGTEITRFTALRHGVLSRYTVLPWEEPPNIATCLRLSSPSTPRRGRPRSIWLRNWPAFFGASAACAWPRPPPIGTGLKMRSRNRGALRRGRSCISTLPASEDVAEAIRATPADTEDAVRDMQEDEAMTRQALDLLNSRRNDPYEAATAALREDTQQWWADTLARDRAELEEDEEAFTADAEGLRRFFLEGEVLPWFEARKKELANRPLIREQAFGESLDPDKLERLGRYEVHLDRKLERTLAMLLRLKDLRQGIAG